MESATWRDAEIDLAGSRLAALREAVAALDNIEPWLDPLERAALGPGRAMLDLRLTSEQARLDAHEAELRRREG